MPAEEEYIQLPESLVASTRFHFRRWVPILVLAVVVGIVGGGVAIVFKWFVDVFTSFFFDFLLPASPLKIGNLNFTYILLPALGGLAIGPVLDKLAPEVFGTGIPEVMESTVMHGGVIKKRTGIMKILAASFTIGTGGSAGREGPIAQIGASFGSALGQYLKLDTPRLRLLVVCGLAAGIASTFNAPFAGGIFAMEVLYESILIYDAVPVFIASAIGAEVSRLYHGNFFLFTANFGQINTPEVFFLLIFGLIFGLLAVLWIKMFYGAASAFDKLKIPRKFKPMIGGAIAGTIAMFLPGMGINGVGYTGIYGSLAGQYALGTLLLLGLMKMFATSSTIGSGGSGGMFAPTLVIGSFFGGAFGLIFQSLFPGVVQDPFLYCFIGMGALFAGASQCPLNIIVMIPEMSGNLSLLLPLMIACMASFLEFSLIMKGKNMYTLKLIRRGVFLHMREGNALEGVKVKEIMRVKLDAVPPYMRVSEFEEIILKTKESAYPITDDGGRILGIATATGVLGIPKIQRQEKSVLDIASQEFKVVLPDESANTALSKMVRKGITELMVVDEKNTRVLIGMVSYADILKAYKFVESTNKKEPKKRAAQAV